METPLILNTPRTSLCLTLHITFKNFSSYSQGVSIPVKYKNMYADFDRIPMSVLSHTEMIFQADNNDLLCLSTALPGEYNGGSSGLTMAYKAGPLKTGKDLTVLSRVEGV